jgi:signal transduction histidine kinase
MPHRARNVPFIVAASIGLVLLVAGTLGWLGWRLLSQEEALVRQRFHDRVEQAADTQLAGFLRTVADTEAWLGQIGTALPAADDGRRGGAVLVMFSADRVQTQPSAVLPYLPAIPLGANVDPSVFAASDVLEFQSRDLAGAAAQLASIARSRAGVVRAEALMRLARVQSKAGRVDQALETYAQLHDEQAIGLADAPYALVSRFARSQLLAAVQPAVAEREAVALAADLQSGRFAVGKAAYAWYDEGTRTLARTSAPPVARARIALADFVDTLWGEWQRFQQSGSRLMTKRLHASGDVPMVAVMNANADRLAAVVYAGAAIRDFGLQPAAAGVENAFRVRLLDERGTPILGDALPASDLKATRTLSAAGLPWTLSLESAASDSAERLLASRRLAFAGALGGVVLLVCAACYAIARGVLREAAAGRLQSDFVSAVSHEFRTPLTTLRQLTELLAHGRVKDEGRRQQYFDVLQKETSRLHQLVENLLDFGRMDAGHRQYQLERLDFSALVRDGVAEYCRESHVNGHRVEMAADASALIVEADPEAMRRVVRNLLENAVKYSPDSPVVWVETARAAHSAVLRVRDEGIGIPGEEHARIFDKFVRGEGAKRACIEGTGIGLAMVKEIVEMHRGDIELSSEVGRGSTFQVRIPLSEATAGSQP